MQNFGVLRHPSSAKDNEQPINWRRGLFRVWLLISVGWIMAWIIYLILNGIHGGFRTSGDFLGIPVLLFGPPTAVLSLR